MSSSEIVGNMALTSRLRGLKGNLTRVLNTAEKALNENSGVKLLNDIAVSIDEAYAKYDSCVEQYVNSSSCSSNDGLKCVQDSLAKLELVTNIQARICEYLKGMSKSTVVSSATISVSTSGAPQGTSSIHQLPQLLSSSSVSM